MDKKDLENYDYIYTLIVMHRDVDIYGDTIDSVRLKWQKCDDALKFMDKVRLLLEKK